MKLIGYYHPESDSTWCIDCDNKDSKTLVFVMEIVPIYNNEKRIKDLVCDQCGRNLKKIGNEKKKTQKA